MAGRPQMYCTRGVSAGAGTGLRGAPGGRRTCCGRPSRGTRRELRRRVPTGGVMVLDGRVREIQYIVSRLARPRHPCRPRLSVRECTTMRRLALAIALVVLSSAGLVAQVTATPARPDSASRRRAAEHVPKRSRADTLRGSFTTPGRKWWDVTFYDLHVTIRPNDSTIAATTASPTRCSSPRPRCRSTSWNRWWSTA